MHKHIHFGGHAGVDHAQELQVFTAVRTPVQYTDDFTSADVHIRAESFLR